METVKVCFRKFPEGDVIALFPGMIETKSGMINSFQHLGQHGAASPELIQGLQPATAQEYAPLLKELESKPYGYELEIVEG